MIYLAVPPENVAEAAELKYGIAYMTYRISGDGHLLRANTIALRKNSIMYLDDNGTVTGSSQLPSEIVRECTANSFTGVVLDLSSDFPRETAISIATACSRHSIKVFVPYQFAYCSDSIVLLSTDISVGSLNTRLTTAIRQYGLNRVALMTDFVRCDYTLPAKEENGQTLSNSQLNALITQYHSPSFYSKDLYTYYFTYRSANKAHLVLYDNAASLRHKLKLGKALGIKTAFMFYPHVKGIINDVLENQTK